VPWNFEHYPDSMVDLEAGVREKAIEIANVLLVQGYGEGCAIRIAIANAKHWAASHETAPVERGGGSGESRR
jgi:uncharacterized protein YdaT